MKRQFVTPSLVLLLLTAGCPSDTEPAEGETSTETGATDPSSGDGDGDPIGGDGDGDPSSGDGDGDPSSGDGDGDPSTGDGDGDRGTGDGDGDPGSGDGDGEPEACDPAAFVGGGIADDGWGVGDYCDLISTCVEVEVVPGLVELGLEDCFGPGGDNPCPDAMAWCIYGEGQVDAGLVELVCESLPLGVDEVTCLVWGP